MTHLDGGERRGRRKVLWVVAGVVLLAVALPPLLRRVARPETHHDAYAAARAAAPAGEFPALVPATATDVWQRHERATGRTWIRFTAPDADLTGATAGLSRVPADSLDTVPVRSPGWAKWWLVSDRTLSSSSQGKHLEVYRAGPGFLVLDRRTATAYYWD